MGFPAAARGSLEGVDQGGWNPEGFSLVGKDQEDSALAMLHQVMPALECLGRVGVGCHSILNQGLTHVALEEGTLMESAHQGPGLTKPDLAGLHWLSPLGGD